MPSNDTELIARLSQDIGRYLDRLERQQRLWIDLENHIAASHIAEYLGDRVMAQRHLQAVTRLMIEIHVACPGPKRPRKRPASPKLIRP